MSGTWLNKTLGDIFDISSSKRVLQKQWQSSGIPFYRAREIVKLSEHGYVDNDLFISEQLFEELGQKFGRPEPGDLMVSAVGTLGACYVVKSQDQFYFKDASVLRFSPKEEIDSRFFQYAFRTDQILNQVNSGSGATVKTFTISRAKKTEITLPPLEEQKRIAGILDAADALRAKRRETLEQLDQLAQSTFLEMFGDPFTNPKGWEVVTLGDASERVTDGTHQSPNWSESGIPFLFVKNIRDRQIDFQTSKFISNKEYQRLTSRCPIEVGDILYTTVGSFGNPAMVRKYMGRFAFQRHIAHIKPKSDLLDSQFLEVMMDSPFARYQANKFARGVAQKTLNLRELKSFKILTPPLPLQKEFALIIESIEKQKKRVKAHLEELDTLFSSLQSRAFKGEL